MPFILVKMMEWSNITILTICIVFVFCENVMSLPNCTVRIGQYPCLSICMCVVH